MFTPLPKLRMIISNPASAHWSTARRTTAGSVEVRCSISGFSVGDNRVRACVWDRDGDGWTATALPQESPQLGTNVIPISPDFVAA